MNDDEHNITTYKLIRYSNHIPPVACNYAHKATTTITII